MSKCASSEPPSGGFFLTDGNLDCWRLTSPAWVIARKADLDGAKKMPAKAGMKMGHWRRFQRLNGSRIAFMAPPQLDESCGQGFECNG
jgi:hypothetical protein